MVYGRLMECAPCPGPTLEGMPNFSRKCRLAATCRTSENVRPQFKNLHWPLSDGQTYLTFVKD